MKKPKPSYTALAVMSGRVSMKEAPLLERVDEMVKAIMVTGFIDEGFCGFGTVQDALSFVEKHVKSVWDYYEEFTESEFRAMILTDLLVKKIANELEEGEE